MSKTYQSPRWGAIGSHESEIRPFKVSIPAMGGNSDRKTGDGGGLLSIPAMGGNSR